MLDRHLVSAMKALDGLAGDRPIATVWRRPEGLVVADMLLRAGTKEDPITTRIIGSSSNPAAVSGITAELGAGSEIDLLLNFDFVPQQYWTGAIRAAYLAVFCAEGYEYALSRGGSQARDVIFGKSPVNPKVIMEAFPEADIPCDVLVMPHSFSDLGECFAVVLRLKTFQTRHLLVYLPGKPGCDWDVLGGLYRHAPRLRFETYPGDSTMLLHIYLGYDPVSELRESNFPFKMTRRLR